ncbi:MAG: hypothetical protein U0Y10_22225 [Spirosomataceae bacterium]
MRLSIKYITVIIVLLGCNQSKPIAENGFVTKTQNKKKLSGLRNYINSKTSFLKDTEATFSNGQYEEIYSFTVIQPHTSSFILKVEVLKNQPILKYIYLNKSKKIDCKIISLNEKNCLSKESFLTRIRKFNYSELKNWDDDFSKYADPTIILVEVFEDKKQIEVVELYRKDSNLPKVLTLYDIIDSIMCYIPQKIILQKSD